MGKDFLFKSSLVGCTVKQLSDFFLPHLGTNGWEHFSTLSTVFELPLDYMWLHSTEANLEALGVPSEPLRLAPSFSVHPLLSKLTIEFGHVTNFWRTWNRQQEKGSSI